MQNTTIQSQHRFYWNYIKQKYKILGNIHGYYSQIGSCSTLIGDNKSLILKLS